MRDRPQYKRQRAPRLGSQPVDKVCVVCGQTFQLANPSAAERYVTCSTECSKERKRQHGLSRSLIALTRPDRQCARCHLVKPMSAFPRVRQGTEKRRSYCNDCNTLEAAVYRRRQADLALATKHLPRSKKCSLCGHMRMADDYIWGADGRRTTTVCIHCRKGRDKEALRCSKCQEVKSARDFYWREDGRLRYRHCRTCQGAMVARWTSQNREKVNAYSGVYRKARSFGMTIPEFEAFEATLPKACEVCGSTTNDSTDGRRLALDHDHATNRLRGVLCGNCNNALGRVGDDAALLEALAAYLRRPPRYDVYLRATGRATSLPS